MRVFTVSNIKGGVGKSSTSIALAHGLSLQGYRVLLIDLESQCNSTLAMLGHDRPEKTALDVFKRTPIYDCIVKTDCGVDFIAGHPDLVNADTSFVKPQEIYYLQEFMKQLDADNAYDFCIIDTPPALGFVTTSALVSSEKVLIPMSPDAFSEQGTVAMVTAVNTVRKYLQNPDLDISGLLITRINQKSTHMKKCEEEIAEFAKTYKINKYKTKIRECVKIPESQSHMKDVYNYDKRSIAAEDYKGFLDEFMKREKIKPNKKQATNEKKKGKEA